MSHGMTEHGFIFTIVSSTSSGGNNYRAALYYDQICPFCNKRGNEPLSKRNVVQFYGRIYTCMRHSALTNSVGKGREPLIFKKSYFL